MAPAASAGRLKVVPLRCNDLLFVNAYIANGRNGTQAYKTVHPKASLPTSAVQASRLLQKPNVTLEIARRTQYDAGVTREFVQGHLLRALDLASDNPQTITTVCRELAELAGLKVLKHEDVSDLARLSTTDRRTRMIAMLADVPSDS